MLCKTSIRKWWFILVMTVLTGFTHAQETPNGLDALLRASGLGSFDDLEKIDAGFRRLFRTQGIYFRQEFVSVLGRQPLQAQLPIVEILRLTLLETAETTSELFSNVDERRLNSLLTRYWRAAVNYLTAVKTEQSADRIDALRTTWHSRARALARFYIRLDRQFFSIHSLRPFFVTLFAFSVDNQANSIDSFARGMQSNTQTDFDDSINFSATASINFRNIGVIIALAAISQLIR